MRGYTHLAAGLALYLALVKLGPLSWSLWGALAIAFGSIVPDVDHPRSLSSRALMHVPLSHRGFMHSLTACAIQAALIAYLDWGLAALYVVGYVAHLALDSLTPMGVAWLAPLSRRRVRGPLKTGGLADHALLALLALTIACLLPMQ